MMPSWVLSDTDPYPRGTYQVRQFGVGGYSVTSALADPPEAMVTAEDAALTDNIIPSP